MKYEILYPGAYPVVKCELLQNESIQAESNAMISMSATLDISGKMTGGFLSGLARKFLTGESLFCQNIVATRGPGTVLFAHSTPGDIIDVTLDGTYGLVVQKGGYLASSPGVTFETKMQNLSQGFLSGEGFFVLNIKGQGTAFLSSYGSIHAINLEQGEEVIIDNGHLVAWPDYMQYTIEKASSSGWISSFTSGEGLVCRFRGPGVVLIQTRNPNCFSQWIQSILPTGGAK